MKQSRRGGRPGPTVPEGPWPENGYQFRVLIFTLLFLDALVLLAAPLLAWHIRIGSGWLPYTSPFSYVFYLDIAIYSVPVLLAIFAFNGLYNPNLLMGGAREYANVFRACSYGMIAFICMSFLQREQELSRGWLLICWMTSIAMVSTERFCLRRFFQWLRRKYLWLVKPVLIVGANEHARTIASKMTAEDAGTHVVGFVDDFLPYGTSVIGDKTVLGSPVQIEQLVEQYGILQIIVVPNAVAWETFQEIMHRAAYSSGVEVRLSPGLYEILLTEVQVTHQGFVHLLRVGQARFIGVDRVMKTLLDLSMSLGLALLFTLPMLLIALVLKLKGQGPVFEREWVFGLNGRNYRTIKFYTGIPHRLRRRLNAFRERKPRNGGSAGEFNLGRLLYLTGLDKLPQLLDVLRGKMSLVGPRTVSLGQELADPQCFSNLLTVKPGWTGPWATSGAQNLEEELKMNLYYIRNWTIWLDLHILFQTAKLVLLRRSRRPQQTDPGT